MNICTKCECLKLLEEFSKDSSNKSTGIRTDCKTCNRKMQAKLRPFKKKEKAAYDRQRWIINKERLLAQNRNWVCRNRARRNEIDRNRHHRKLANLGDVPTDIKEILFKQQQGICFYCKASLEKSHLEHKTPISRGGLHDRNNLCLSCPPCNLKKGTKTVEEFLETI